jgi:hypothetical protein
MISRAKMGHSSRGRKDGGFMRGVDYENQTRSTKKQKSQICNLKSCFPSRGAAEFARRRMPNSGLRVFPCPVTFDHFHLGRLEHK